jgi:hypothetical protein
VWWKIGVLLGNGPFWYRWLSFTHRCDMYFWTNIVFVNNLVPYDISESDECFYISWFVLVPLLLSYLLFSLLALPLPPSLSLTLIAPSLSLFLSLIAFRYLADDMQFYLVSPLFVCLYLVRDWLGVLSALAALAASCALGFAGTLTHGWSAHSFDGLDVTKYSHAFYTKPTTGSAPTRWGCWPRCCGTSSAADSPPSLCLPPSPWG